MNWRALVDLIPRKVASLSDAKRSAWKLAPGDGILKPRVLEFPVERVRPMPENHPRWDENLPVLLHGPQVDEYGNWKRH